MDDSSLNKYCDAKRINEAATTTTSGSVSAYSKPMAYSSNNLSYLIDDFVKKNSSRKDEDD